MRRRVSIVLSKGVFAAWNDPAFFQSVYASPHGGIAWSEDIELCADSIYLELRGKKPEELLPRVFVQP